jgi:hypothetical protein
MAKVTAAQKAAARAKLEADEAATSKGHRRKMEVFEDAPVADLDTPCSREK